MRSRPSDEDRFGSATRFIIVDGNCEPSRAAPGSARSPLALASSFFPARPQPLPGSGVATRADGAPPSPRVLRSRSAPPATARPVSTRTRPSSGLLSSSPRLLCAGARHSGLTPWPSFAACQPRPWRHPASASLHPPASARHTRGEAKSTRGGLELANLREATSDDAGERGFA